MGCDDAASEVLREGLAVFPTSERLLSLAAREGLEAAPLPEKEPSGEFRVEEHGFKFYANSFEEFRQMGCVDAAFEVLSEGLAVVPTSAELQLLAESSEAAVWILEEEPSGEFWVEEPGFGPSTTLEWPSWRVQLLAKASTALAYCLGERDCLRLAEAGLREVGGHYSQNFPQDDDDSDNSDITWNHDLATALCDLARSFPGVNEPPAGVSIASSCKALGDGRTLIGADGRTLSPTALVF